MALYNTHPNVTETTSLTTRLEINGKYGAFDFHDWVTSRMAVRPGMDVLDVGCGTGVHAINALESMGGCGSVSAMDISAESIQTLTKTADRFPNLHAVVGDMKDLTTIIRHFTVPNYDLAYSVYALWYATDHFGALDAMRNALRPNGRLVVCTPHAPNGLREVLKRIGLRRPELDQVTNFGPNVLEPYFRAYFDSVVIHLRRNSMRITKCDDVIRFYRAAGYYERDMEPHLRRYVEAEIEAVGYFRFEKNNYLIEGTQLQ